MKKPNVKEFYFAGGDFENATLSIGDTVIVIKDHQASIDIDDPTTMRLVEMFGGTELAEKSPKTDTPRKAVSDNGS